MYCTKVLSPIPLVMLLDMSLLTYNMWCDQKSAKQHNCLLMDNTGSGNVIVIKSCGRQVVPSGTGVMTMAYKRHILFPPNLVDNPSSYDSPDCYDSLSCYDS